MRNRSLTVGLAGFAVLAASCGSADPTFNGQPIAAAADLIEQADRTFTADTGEHDYAVGDEARCYYLTVDADSDDVTGRVACGPVGYRGAEGPWLHYDLYGDPTEDVVSLHLGEFDPHATQLASSLTPLRPDGQTPPDELFVAPRAEQAGTAFRLESLPMTVDDGFAEGAAYVRYPAAGSHDAVFEAESGDEVQVRSVHRLEQFGEGYDTVTAPEGHELVVIHLGGNYDALPTALLVGSSRIDAPGHGAYLVAAVPEGDDLALEFTRDDIVQRLSLADGTRSGEAPDLWYRDDTSGRLGHLYADDETRTVVTNRNNNFSSEYTFRIEMRFTDATLQLRNDEGTLAPDGQAWLRIDVEDIAYESGSSSTRWNAEMQLALALDGNTIEPTSQEVAGGWGGSSSYWFLVDGDFTGATLTMEPGGRFVHESIGGRQNDSGTVTLKADEVEFTLG